jgi:hypothetical protein
MFHLFLLLLLYGILSLLSMTVVWAMIARKGFEGLESSNSFLARFFTRFAKPRRQSYVIGYDYSAQTSNTAAVLFRIPEQQFGLESPYANYGNEVQSDTNVLENSQVYRATGTCAVGLG